MTTIAQLLEVKGHDVWSVGPESSVSATIELMAKKEVGALIVMDGAKPVGVISERDCLRKVFLPGRTASETRVKDVMTRRVIYAPPDHTVDACMALMTNKRIRHLPVLEDGRVVGVVSIGDLVKATIDEQQHTIDQLVNYITG
ncbi:MAG: CBS domain-containing protein [Gammaproteobacteria bacterium]|nr:CBS domain-containing protein [Gammaproteobacteria bacterium]MDJ0871625.1 CBS domain-containing protein [Gammaproteobacteria bacterium]MDJ0890364.1 CBS domain-containing protein [Gammaproteobacteria bacterium]